MSSQIFDPGPLFIKAVERWKHLPEFRKAWESKDIGDIAEFTGDRTIHPQERRDRKAFFFPHIYCSNPMQYSMGAHVPAKSIRIPPKVVGTLEVSRVHWDEANLRAALGLPQPQPIKMPEVKPLRKMSRALLNIALSTELSLG